MDAETIVRKKYPLAEAVFEQPVYQQGQLKSYQDGEWLIYSGHALGAETLGRGPTAQAAWQDAASKLLGRATNEQDNPTP
jgi:hypothetical protein